jgi:hypothetical protein
MGDSHASIDARITRCRERLPDDGFVRVLPALVEHHP